MMLLDHGGKHNEKERKTITYERNTDKKEEI